MSGINSLSGLNKVNVDFRPTVNLEEQNKVNANEPQQVQGAAPENAQPVKEAAKSVVRQLDVLLLGAAKKSVGADVVKNVETVGQSLVRQGVLSETDVTRLKNLAESAAEKLKALDKFKGMDFAKAIIKIDGAFDFDENSEIGKAVKKAIDAQLALSEELGKFNGRLAANSKVSAALQDQFTELQFQCDRRATEIDSIAFRMFDLAQKDVVNGAAGDPQIKALLDSAFSELMPREAIMMHGTAEAFEKLGEKLRPFAKKLDAFSANGTKILTKAEIKSLETEMALVKNAIANVRKNGLEIKHDNQIVSRIEVDKSLLDAMDQILADTKKQIDDAKKTSVNRTIDAFIKEVDDSLYPEKSPGAGDVNLTSVDMLDFKSSRADIMKAFDDFAKGKINARQFDDEIERNLDKFNNGRFHMHVLRACGYKDNAAAGILKTMRGLNIIKSQFRELVKNAKKQSDLATSDVRRIMLGEVGLSNVVEASVRGFKPTDIDPAADESAVVDSKPLGAGNSGKTYLVTTKSGGELVFKPEFDSRIGLSTMVLASGGAYKDTQNTANLNLATQDTAKAFGCEDLVVKYSVGSHDGQFGFFMEKAKGFSGEEMGIKNKDEGDGITPAALKTITDPAERSKIQGQVAKKLNKLQWLDLITGQGDRHWNNYFVHIDKTTHDVSVKAIDNDASFSANRTGLQKFRLGGVKAESFLDMLEVICKRLHDKDADDEYKKRVSNDPAITRNGVGEITVDLSKAQSPEVKMALNKVMGLQSIAMPEEIDQEFYNKLMEMDGNPDQRKAYLDSIAPRLSPEALDATAKRLDEAIAHAKKLKDENKVYSDAKWQNPNTLAQMPGLKNKVEIAKSDGTNVTVGNKIGFVGNYCVVDCPSYYKRDYLDRMFK